MTIQTADEFFSDLRTSNTIFGATTLRKNDKKVDGVVVAKAGDEIISTYRLGVKATIKDANTRLPQGLREFEDQDNAVLTVYDMTKTDDGAEKKGVFRRIDLQGIVEIRVNGAKFESVWNDDDNTWMIQEKS